MAPLRRNVTRKQWLLFALSLISLVTYLAEITPTCSGRDAEESPVITHVSKSRERISEPPGENPNPPYGKDWSEQDPPLEDLPAASPTHRSVPAVTEKGQKAKSSSNFTEEVVKQSQTSDLGDDASSRITCSTDIASSSDTSGAANRIAPFSAPEQTEESDASTGPYSLRTELDEDRHCADQAETSWAARTTAEDVASLEASPVSTPNVVGTTEATSASPPASTSGFRGTNNSKENVAQPVPPLRQETAFPPEGLDDLLLSFLSNPTKAVPGSISRRSTAVGETTLDPSGRRNDAAASATMFGWPRLLEAKDLEDQIDEKNRNELAQTCRRIEVLQARAAEHTSEFEAAAGRACSPSNYAKYVDIVQNQMDGALGNLEDLINKVTSGWLNNAFGYEDLSALLNDRITVWEYAKKDAVFLALVCMALGLVFIWLFCCTPKICCRYCRRLCFCIPERVHKVGFMGRLVVTVIGAVALLTTVVFAILAAASQYNGIGGVRALQCHLYTTVEEIIKGSNTTTVEPNEQFVGVAPLFRELKEVSAKLDTNSPQGIVADLRRQVTTDLDFSKGIAASNGYLTAVKQALSDSSNNVETFHHTCHACEAVKTGNPVGDALASLEKAITSPALDMSAKVEELFTKFTFPSVVLEDVIPVEEVEKVLEHVTDALVEVEPQVTSGLMYTDVSFGVAYAFVFLMACVGVAWVVFFFFRGARTGSTPACVQWNVLCFSMFLILLVAGVIGFATSTAIRGCEYANKELVVEDNWDDLMNKVDPDDGHLSQLVKGCFGSAGAGNLVDILGYRPDYEAMIHQVDSALDDLVNKLPSTPSVAVQDQLNTVRTVARGYGWAATANVKDPSFDDPKINPNSRLNTLVEFLSSGVQLEDRNFDATILDSTAPSGSTVTLYGLRSLEKLVQPWKFSAIRGKDSDDKFLISDTYPQEADATFTTWLDNYEKETKAKLDAQGDANAAAKSKTAATQMKNAIWWSVQKHKVLFKTYKCPEYDPATNTVTQRACTGQTFFAYTPYDWSKSYVVGTTEKLVETVSSLADTILNAPTTASNNASGIILDLLKKVKSLVKGLNCKFMRRGFVTGTNIACNRAFLPIHKAALYSIVTCAGILLWTLLLLIVWRKLKDNETLKKKK